MNKVSKLQIGEEVYVVKDSELDGVKADVVSNTTNIGQNTTKIGSAETKIVNINNRLDSVEGGIGVVGVYDSGTETLTLQ